MQAGANEMKELNDGLPAGSRSLLIWATVISGAWIIVAIPVALAYFPPPIDQLELNELGDFVAGASAPLAFLWLVVAVFLQSRELREQRHELSLTRAEFVNSREVMRAQAEEARKHVEMIGTQTALLLQAEGEREFDAHIAHLATRFRLYKHIWDFEDLNGKIEFRRPAASDSDLTMILAVQKALASTRRRFLSSKRGDQFLGLEAKYPKDWYRTYDVLLACIRAQEKLNGSARAHADAYNLNTLWEDMEWLLSNTPELVKKRNREVELKHARSI